MYLEALPGMCLVVGTGRRIVSSARDFVAVGRGSRTGPIRADFGAPAASVYGMMTTFERDDGGAPAGTVARLDDGAVVREFETPVPLPFGLRRAVRTREEIRLVRPAAITFRHLAGPVRGMEELIVVEPLGEERCRVTYTGELPPSGPALRVAYRLIARPVIERIVRAHLAELARRAEKLASGGVAGPDRAASDPGA
jgi:hypothetical protein